ncbi:MAG TPA: hypothetical protein VKU02_10120 [Gemmataceae bacterium]|nr:hypothetical protein [Gemmataceae bacterium]
MAKRQQLVLVLVGVFFSLGATYRSPNGNFLVEAPTPQIARQVGDWAEHYRKEKAIQWLGKEMPPWPEPCPLHVKITFGGSGGATTFNFDFAHGQVWQTMQIEGALDRLLASVLPHEVTHTVFAYYFRCPVPRWADEGGAVLSEDDLERTHHDQLVRQILNARREIPLRRLFNLREYPHDVGALYAEGYSVASFLVHSRGPQAFLAFVAQGMQGDWDAAAQAHYRYQNIEQLETAWKNYLISTKGQPPTLLAQNSMSAAAAPANRIVDRLTAPPVQPLQDVPLPIIRAQSPDPEPSDRWTHPTSLQAAGRPGYLPNFDSNPTQNAAASPTVQPAPVPRDPWQPPGARLGMPQFTSPAGSTGTASPSRASPVGYPN